MKVKQKRVLMLVENHGYPCDTRAMLEAKELVALGFDVSVICPTDQSRKLVETVDTVHVYRYPKPFHMNGFLGYVWEYGYSLTMQFLISVFVFFRRGFDVVHVHTPPDLMALIAIFYQFLGKRFVFDLRDLSPELYLARRGDDKPNFVYKLLRVFERLACRRADRCIATNETQRSVQVERCGADMSHCYVARYGPTESFLKDVQPRAELRKPGRFVLGFVGEIGIQDGVEYMVRVIHEIKFVHGRKDFIALIVGDGPALTKLKRLANEIEVSDVMQFTGIIPFESVPSYIAAFDVCFTPDPSNAYNDSCTTVKTMEYMALRKPTVCFRTHENEVTAGDAALYADNNDVATFAELAIQLMDDPALRESMGEIARRRIDNGLRWEHQSVHLVAVYNDLFGLSGHRGTGRDVQDEAFAENVPEIENASNA